MNMKTRKEVLQQVIELKQALVDLREYAYAAKLRDLQRELEIKPYEEELSFPARFKVGDNIRATSWGSDTYETIVHIDTYGFATKDSDGCVYSYEFNDLEWESCDEVCEPEEAELELQGLQKFLVGDGSVYAIVYAREKTEHLSSMQECYTIDEALEKGLIL